MEKIPIMRIENIAKKFGGLTAVDNVNYQINEGERLGIIGPNGAGKTTFFNLITGLLSSDHGNITYMGKDITKLPSYKRVEKGIARTFQLVSVLNSLRVIDNLVLANVRFGINYKRKSKLFFENINRSDIIDNCFTDLKIMHLEKKAFTMTDELSYGDKRKLELAIVLSLKPKILLLDEPFAGLNDLEIIEIIKIIKGMKEDFSLVIIEHKISQILDLVDKLAVMHEGKLIANAEPKTIISDPFIKEIYWGKEKGFED